MKKSLIAALIATAFVPGLANAADEPASPHTVTGNMGIVSDYVFRGISQTDGGPALQGGFDYAHSSGFYAGTWLSSISWVSDGQGGSYPTEIDVYGGFKGAVTDAIAFDVGAITYNYPGSGRDKSTYVEPFTAEIYGALTWQWLTFKGSYVVSDDFVGWGSVANDVHSDGSYYLELNVAYPLDNGWTILAHVGDQTVENHDSNKVTAGYGYNASYTDWSIGVTKDIGYGVVGLKYSDTDSQGCGSATEAYCWVRRSAGQGVAVVSFTKTF